MPCTLNKKAWEKLIDEDIEWLDKQPDILECKHIRQILEWTKTHRPDKEAERIKELEAALEAIWPFLEDDFPKGTGDNHGTCATETYRLAARQIEQARKG